MFINSERIGSPGGGTPSVEERILRVVEEAGEVGITSRQIAQKLGMKRETVSHYLWILKKAGKVRNVHRNLWVKA